MELKVHTDGGSRGNPGPSAVGCLIESPTGVLAQFGLYIGVGTNNEAEYKAVITAIKWIQEQKNIAPTALHFYLDSQLVVSQLTGKFQVKHPEMIKLKAEVVKLLGKFPVKADFNYVPRAQNSIADSMVNLALDEIQK